MVLRLILRVVKGLYQLRNVERTGQGAAASASANGYCLRHRAMV
jgi:hypothetical protein